MHGRPLMGSHLTGVHFEQVSGAQSRSSQMWIFVTWEPLLVYVLRPGPSLFQRVYLWFPVVKRLYSFLTQLPFRWSITAVLPRSPPAGAQPWANVWPLRLTQTSVVAKACAVGSAALAARTPAMTVRRRDM
ncbi:hypothetical protein DZF91_13105 [Actinomadura logoneensis]|uniref:Uncharacterized protein n=1 Tax=Actinomadura logoneensis TaxID=2293572 RepID=A0A372JMF9_9ACTN|nr:hypothetical protein DZF91_13105 [Actinomadura logoneensis]